MACTRARQSRLVRESFGVGEYGPGIAVLLAQTKIRSSHTSRRFAGGWCHALRSVPQNLEHAVRGTLPGCFMRCRAGQRVLA